MARNVGGTYSLPSGSLVTDGVDDILATQHNTPLQDIADDLNIARPIVAGGTGATSAAGALVNFGLTATAAEINAIDGVTATGTSLIQAADAAAGRSALSASPLEQSGAGVGQTTPISSGSNVALSTPSGGTWAYFAWRVTDLGAVVNGTQVAGVAAGSTVILAATPGNQHIGFAKRIA